MAHAPMGLPAELLIDVAEALRGASYDGPVWSANSEQLNVNLLRLATGASIPEHVNDELDVLVVVFEGAGELAVEGIATPLGPGTAALIPRGRRRSLRCSAGPLVYLTCHRLRSPLLPTMPARRPER